MVLYALTIFLAAFLLFQIQPMIGKMILPWFGGCSAVWNTCMLFFQGALLLGYLYAHGLHEGLSARKQRTLHTILLLASLAALPVVPNPAWKGSGAENPSWQILGLLAVTVGLPYFLLSTTSPLLQSWYAGTHLRAVPYRLFALSNLASMLALLSYPVLVEPNLSTRRQAQVWSAAYACFAVLCGVTAWQGAGRPAQADPPAAASHRAAPEAPGWGPRLLWMALAACASTLLLSVTTHLTQDVAAIPFLWILPLSAYLLSFIICFEAPRLYWRRVYLGLLIPALGGTAYLLWPGGPSLTVVQTILFLVSALFIFCMVCHGELVRMKPHPRHLTVFYVMLSVGGAAGGLFVGLLAPNLFNGSYEFPIGLALCASLAAMVLLREQRAFFRRGWGRACGFAMLVALGAYAVFLGLVVRDSVKGYRLVARNFYSQLRIREVAEEDDVGVRRKLVHGVINHGEQILDPQWRRKPGTYFCPETGIGRVMQAGKEGVPRRIGILGLGCGTLAAYGRSGDIFRIYEINPLVLQLARSEFTYLQDTPARVETVLGDGRLSLEREPNQHFDILVMDAFSGDSVPVHLITREAFRTYLRHLKPGGILAVNVSNKYLDLRPVMERGASYFGKVALYFSFTPEEDDPLCFGAGWVLILDAATRDALASLLGSAETLPPSSSFRIWTDDFSSMHGILK